MAIVTCWPPAPPPRTQSSIASYSVPVNPASRWKKSPAQESGSNEIAAVPAWTTPVCARSRVPQDQSVKPFWRASV